MKLIRLIHTFFKMEKETKLLIIEAFVLLGYARIQKMREFSHIVNKLGVPGEESPLTISKENLKTIKKVSSAIHIASKYTIWESKCLVRAIAVIKMLERRKIDSTLYLGTAMNPEGKLIAHAWIRSGSYYITGAEEMNKFTVVGKFARHVIIHHTGRSL